jgi:hypothetical protein
LTIMSSTERQKNNGTNHHHMIGFLWLLAALCDRFPPVGVSSHYMTGR